MEKASSPLPLRFAKLEKFSAKLIRVYVTSFESDIDE
jgi:hypothetical protein